MPGPLPPACGLPVGRQGRQAAAPVVLLPVSSHETSAFPTVRLEPVLSLSKDRRLAITRTATSVRSSFSRLQSFASLQARKFARHPGRPYRSSTLACRFLACSFPPRFQESASISQTLDSSSSGQPWLFHLNNSWFVTSPSPRYASRPNRAIDDKGLSPHKIHSLVGCPPAEKLSRRAAVQSILRFQDWHKCKSGRDLCA